MNELTFFVVDPANRNGGYIGIRPHPAGGVEMCEGEADGDEEVWHRLTEGQAIALLLAKALGPLSDMEATLEATADELAGIRAAREAKL
jgi:hypothetical protein